MPRKKPGRRERQERRALRLNVECIEVRLNESGLPLTPRALEHYSPLSLTCFTFPDSSPQPNLASQKPIYSKELAAKLKRLFGDDED